jgi:hypothetical protein
MKAMNTPLDSPAREMRLTMRVLARWRDLCSGREFPRLADIDPAAFGEDWCCCLSIRMDPTPLLSRFVYIGDTLFAPADESFVGKTIADSHDNTILHKATAYLGRVIDRRVPISVGGATLHLGHPIVFRSILLPLSDNGGDIDGMLGAANFREIPFTEEVHPK